MLHLRPSQSSWLQVWERSPGGADSSFFDNVWGAIDEVLLFTHSLSHVSHVRRLEAPSLALPLASNELTQDAIFIF